MTFLFKKLKKIFTKDFFWIFSSPKVVQPYFHLKTCCIVTNNKYIPDKAVSRLFCFTFRLLLDPYICLYWNTKSVFQLHNDNTFSITKNPAYGRQSISRPMRIVAPMPKNPASKAKFAEKKKLFLRGDFTPFINKSFLERLYNLIGKHSLLILVV